MRLCLVDLDKWMMVNEKRSKIQVKLKFNKQMFHMIFFPITSTASQKNCKTGIES